MVGHGIVGKQRSELMGLIDAKKNSLGKVLNGQNASIKKITGSLSKNNSILKKESQKLQNEATKKAKRQQHNEKQRANKNTDYNEKSTKQHEHIERNIENKMCCSWCSWGCSWQLAHKGIQIMCLGELPS